MLRPVLASLAVWGTAGFVAVVGVTVAVAAVVKLGWLAPDDRRGAFIGGIVGFAVAIPIAVTDLHTPVIPVLACGLVGVGLLLGVGVARRRPRRRPS